MHLMMLMALPLLIATLFEPQKPSVLHTDNFEHYSRDFNLHDREVVKTTISNESASEWMQKQIPLFECPDKEIEQTYYFRWWTYRKHLRQTPDGWVITEFLPDVPWAGKYNTISCAASHHIMEGRWLAETQYLNDYSVFWFRKGGDPHRYSFWAADAIWQRSLVTGNLKQAFDLLPDLVKNFETWQQRRQDPNGLFWQNDDEDGMEVSIGGSGYRATINSYMFAEATAIAKIAQARGDAAISNRFKQLASEIKERLQKQLWDNSSEFFKVLPKGEGAKLAEVRELHGYTPWYFDLPDEKYSVAWKQLMLPEGFNAPFGLTTAERRSPRFMFAFSHECLWNGPVWPYATSITLTAMANLLNDYHQTYVTSADYLAQLHTYATSHKLKQPDGTTVPWIDEDMDPLTGDWTARTILEKQGTHDRGKDYNHSTFCDLVISGLVGIRPQPGNRIVISPLVPADKWDYFCLDRVPYHGHILTVLYDKTGARYGKGKGLHVLSDGKEIAHSATIARIEATVER